MSTIRIQTPSSRLVEIVILVAILVFYLIAMQLSYGQLNYNATTGNYVDDVDNPNNAENIIIQYCIVHADKVAAGENVVHTLVGSGLIPIFYNNMTCTDVQEQHRLNKLIHESQDSLRESLFGGSNSEKDKLARELFENLPKDTQENLLESLAK